MYSTTGAGAAYPAGASAMYSTTGAGDWRRRHALDAGAAYPAGACAMYSTTHTPGAGAMHSTTGAGAGAYPWRTRDVLNDGSWCCICHWRRRCVLGDRCGCSVSCWRRHSTTEAGDRRRRHVLDDRCRCSVSCWRGRDVLHNECRCCVYHYRGLHAAKHLSLARSRVTNKHLPTLVLSFASTITTNSLSRELLRENSIDDVVHFRKDSMVLHLIETGSHSDLQVAARRISSMCVLFLAARTFRLEVDGLLCQSHPVTARWISALVGVGSVSWQVDHRRST